MNVCLGNKEPQNFCGVIDADRIFREMNPLALVQALEIQHRENVERVERFYTTQPTGLPGGNGFLIWPAWQFGKALGAKLVTVFPENGGKNLGPTVHSVYVLMDGVTGAPRCLIMGESFTRWKTAADSALAARLLARSDVKVLLVVGAGAQAKIHVQFLLAVRPGIERILVWNRSVDKAQALVASLLGENIPAAVAPQLDAAVRSADIVTCLTSSSKPLVMGEWLKPGCHLDLVGGFTPNMRETDDAAMVRGRIFVDHRGLAMLHCGDIQDPLVRGVLKPSDILADLFDLCRGQVAGRGSDREISIFKNGGGGHLDLMVAQMLEATFRHDFLPSQE